MKRLYRSTSVALIANMITWTMPAMAQSSSPPPGVKLSTFPAAFAVRRGDMDFVNYLNTWIASRTANQWLDDRLTYWFKGTDWTKNL
jgi:ABC-type amino acid transport substrate-binding protein